MKTILFDLNEEDFENLEKIRKYEESCAGKKLTIDEVISITIQEVYKEIIVQKDKAEIDDLNKRIILSKL